MPLTDKQIIERCIDYDYFSATNDMENSYVERPMVKPFIIEKRRYTDYHKPAISYGLSSMGYDIRLGTKFGMVDGLKTIDPKEDNFPNFRWFEERKSFILPARSFILAVSYERFIIPDDVIGLATDKSTYARTGIITNTTPLEPSWEGHLTLEIHNPTNHNITLHPLEGIIQVMFFEANDEVYALYDGKYQKQGYEPVVSQVG